jgi:O-antigen/teichoic acid export membrane protein
MAEPTPASTTTSTPDPVGDVARGSLVNVAGAAASAVTTFGLTLALARGLDPEQAGAFFAITSLFLLLSSVGQLGTGTGLVYFIAGGRATARGPAPSAYVKVAAGPVLLVATVSAAALVLAAGPLASWMGASDESAFRVALVVVAVSLPLAATLNLYTSASRGLGNMRITVLFDQVARPVLQIFLVVAALPTGSLPLVVLGWSLPYLPTALGSWAWWRRREGRAPALPTDQRRRVRREFWRFSVPRAFAGVAQLAMQRFDIVLVGALVGLEEAAVYTAASRFLVVGQLAGTAIGRAVQPLLAGALRRGDLDTAARLYALATGWLVLLAWPIYFLLALFADTLLTIFGPAYTEGATVLVVLCLSMLVATGCGMVDVVLTMAGKTAWNLYNVLLAFAVNLVLDLLLIPPLGILGAALGWAAAILCNNLLPLAQVRFAIGVHPFHRSTLLSMAAASGSFLALPLLARAVVGPGWATLFGSALVATVVLGGLCWAFARPLALTTLWVSLRRRSVPSA